MVRRSSWAWVTVLLMAGCGGGSAQAPPKGGASGATPNQGAMRLWASDGGSADLATVHESQRETIRGFQQLVEGSGGAHPPRIDVGLDKEGKAATLRIKASQPLDLSKFKPLTTLVNVRLEGEGVTDATVAPAKGAEKLRIVWLLKTKVSDTGMRSFAPSVMELTTYGTPITGAGLAHWQQLVHVTVGKDTGLKGEDLRQLQSLPKLRSMHMVQGTDEDLSPIAKISSLKSLILVHTGVTDAGIEHLRSHPSLTVLMLTGTKVTDAGLPAVATLPKLKRLAVNSTDVTDVGIAHLKASVTLEELRFGDTQVSDQALVHLEGLSKLRLVDAVGSRVTEAAAKTLESALSNAVVFVRPDDRRDVPRPEENKKKKGEPKGRKTGKPPA